MNNINKSAFPIPESVSFPEAITLTQSLLQKMEAGELENIAIEKTISSLVATENGARGFFVTYLTDEGDLADKPTEAVIKALQSSPEIVSQLLVKNIAMSTAMAITHRRQDNETMAQSSQKVSRRSAELIKQLNLDGIPQKLEKLHHSAVSGEGEYQGFLERWGYDSEQKQAIATVIASLSI